MRNDEFTEIQKGSSSFSMAKKQSLSSQCLTRNLNPSYWTKLLGFSQFKIPNPNRLPKQSRKLAFKGEGELQAIFEKDALSYEGTQKLQNIMNTALQFQGFFFLGM